MSAHDRGAFGQMLAEAKSLGINGLDFYVDLDASEENQERWFVTGFAPGRWFFMRVRGCESGRTGEEALRRLVEKLRGASEIS